MYLLDTNHCSYIINNTPSVIAALRSRSANEIGISIITYGELLYMSEKSDINDWAQASKHRRRSLNIYVVSSPSSYDLNSNSIELDY